MKFFQISRLLYEKICYLYRFYKCFLQLFLDLVYFLSPIQYASSLSTFSSSFFSLYSLSSYDRSPKLGDILVVDLCIVSILLVSILWGHHTIASYSNLEEIIDTIKCFIISSSRLVKCNCNISQ